LRDYQAFYVPLLFVPLENCMLMDKRGAELNSLSKARWQLLTRCWEYNVRIWRDTFLKHRIANPLLFNFAKKIVIPYAGKVAGFYYKMKHGDEMERAIWRMVNA
jgi:hypothetical protein